LLPHRGHQEDAGQREVVGRGRNGRCGHDLRVFREIQTRNAVQRAATLADWMTRMGMSGRLDPSMSAKRANSSNPLWGAGWTKVTNARDSTGAITFDHSRGGSMGVLSSATFSRYRSVRYWLHVKT